MRGVVEPDWVRKVITPEQSLPLASQFNITETDETIQVILRSETEDEAAKFINAL